MDDWFDGFLANELKYLIAQQTVQDREAYLDVHWDLSGMCLGPVPPVGRHHKTPEDFALGEKAASGFVKRKIFRKRTYKHPEHGELTRYFCGHTRGTLSEGLDYQFVAGTTKHGPRVLGVYRTDLDTGAAKAVWGTKLSKLGERVDEVIYGEPDIEVPAFKDF